MGLVITKKAKYMAMTKNVTVKDNLCTKGLIFENLEDFKYLIVNINKKNNKHNENRMRLMFFSKLLLRNTKEHLHCT